jgi:hypothetical protein
MSTSAQEVTIADETATVIIDGVKISVDLIRDVLLTYHPRKQVVRHGGIVSALKSWREGDVVTFEMVALVPGMAAKILEFLEVSATFKLEGQ